MNNDINYYKELIKNSKMPPVYAVATERDLPMNVEYGSMGYATQNNSACIFTGNEWVKLPPATYYDEIKESQNDDIITRAVIEEQPKKSYNNRILDRIFNV